MSETFLIVEDDEIVRQSPWTPRDYKLIKQTCGVCRVTNIGWYAVLQERVKEMIIFRDSKNLSWKDWCMSGALKDE